MMKTEQGAGIMKEEFESLFEEEINENDNELALESEDELSLDEQTYDVDTADLLKMYLREASRTPMLDAAGEINAARRIERARNRLLRLLSRSPIVAEFLLHLKEELRRGAETASDVIEQIRLGDMPQLSPEAIEWAF